MDMTKTTVEHVESGITPGGTTGAFRDVLAKNHARRGKPPVHFTDMTPEERIEAAKGLGLPKFRVKQLANHYYGHFDTEAAQFTDFPAAARQGAQEVFSLRSSARSHVRSLTMGRRSRRCGTYSTDPRSNPC